MFLLKTLNDHLWEHIEAEFCRNYNNSSDSNDVNKTCVFDHLNAIYMFLG